MRQAFALLGLTTAIIAIGAFIAFEFKDTPDELNSATQYSQ